MLQSTITPLSHYIRLHLLSLKYLVCADCVLRFFTLVPVPSTMQDDNRYHEDIFGVTLRTYEVTNRLRSESIAHIEESKKDTDE